MHTESSQDEYPDTAEGQIARLEAQRDTLLEALRPFAGLAEVLREQGLYLNFRGYYIGYEQVQAAAEAVAKVRAEVG